MSERVRHHKTNRDKSPIAAADILEADSDDTSKPLLGECPPFVDKASWVNDSIEGKAYMIGGIHDESYIPTSHFYCLDIASMTWRNLTDSLRYRDLDSPFSAANCALEYKRIPRLSLPGCTLFRLHQTSFILLFGGYDDDLEVASSRLIVINLGRLEWWYQPVQSGIVAGRIEPTIVAIDRTLYIFGGFRHFPGDGQPHASYSIATLSEDGKAWSWEARDVPYPENVPQGSIFSEATAIYLGKKILLSPWRTTKSNRINFKEDNIFCFHIAQRRFQLVQGFGPDSDFPKNLGWYFVYAMPLPPAVSPINAPSLYPPVIICGWTIWTDGSFLPDVWEMGLCPIDHIRQLNVGPIVDKLDSQLDSESDLRTSVMVGDRLFLLGSRPEGTAGKKEVDLKYNVYFEVPLRRLCES